MNVRARDRLNVSPQSSYPIRFTHMRCSFLSGGDVSIDDRNFSVSRFTHALIVFGGVAGIEECIDADETSKLPGAESKKLFDLWYVTINLFVSARE